MSTPATHTPDAETQPTTRIEDLRVPHVPEAVSAVRRRARAVLARWLVPTSTADDALLVISELTTNAIVHALPPTVLRLSMPEDGTCDALRVEVTDAGPVRRQGSSRRGPHVAELLENGRGTGIVAALSARHGISRHPGRTTRWAVLHVTA
ncbi:ATP-binding protein [Streptomyces sp. NPDC001351]|uniref:ATP-binding protein n=1 Tax=Streptomyces sp. NPDC001351 TaxID=3364564 RepID=UPI00369FC43E